MVNTVDATGTGRLGGALSVLAILPSEMSTCT
jgi:hypothetical protein